MRVCTKQNKRDREQDNDSGESKRNSSRCRPTVASKQQELENDYFKKPRMQEEKIRVSVATCQGWTNTLSQLRQV